MTPAYQQRKQEIEALARQLQENLRPWSVGDADRGNHVGLLVNGQATFDSILGRIAQARQYVLVQFYMLDHDGTGRRMQQALIERARSGVRVYVLYDEVGSLPGC